MRYFNTRFIRNPRTGVPTPFRNVDTSHYSRARWHMRQALRGSLFSNPHSYTRHDYHDSYDLYSRTIPLGSARRGTFATTNPYLSSLLLLNKIGLSSPKLPLNEYQDRRLWHPLGANRPAVSLTESYPQLTLKPPRRKMVVQWPPQNPIRRIHGDDININTGEVVRWGAYDPFKISWANPYKMLICLKRKARREVMHASGMAGQSGFKKPKWTQYSYVRCF